ncbi:MAG: tetratricopeptide repeat protein [Myxococcota bacterium]
MPSSLHETEQGSNPNIRILDLDEPPGRIGRYTLRSRQGSGAAGVVYLAHDTRADRPVALKVLRRRIDEVSERRIRRESQALARLSHPNVVQVFEVGVDGEHLFIAMEWVDGLTLNAWLDEAPRSVDEILEVFTQAGRGLAAVHARSVVHRDFKPSNVMVGREGRVQVVDFGLARAADFDDVEAPSSGGAPEGPASSTASGSQTKHSNLAGTPAYMAPELYSSKPADPLSDQYAFCVALYEALYDEHPFAGEDWDTLAVQVLAGEVRSPPINADRQVSTRLRSVLLRGLCTENRARWPSMEALLDALGDQREGRRSRWWWLGGAGLAATAVGVGLWGGSSSGPQCTDASHKLEGVWDAQRKQELHALVLGSEAPHASETWARLEPMADAYADAWATAHRQACEATVVEQRQSPAELDRRMTCLESNLDAFSSLVTVLAEPDTDVLDHALDAAAELPAIARCSNPQWLQSELAPPVDPEVVALVRQQRERLALVEARTRMGKMDEAIALAESTLSAADEVGYPPLVVESQVALGRALFEAGDYQRAEPALEDAYFGAAALAYDRQSAIAVQSLGLMVGVRLKRHDDGLAWVRQCQGLAERSKGALQRAACLSLHGAITLSQGHYDQARGYYGEALSLREEHLPPTDPRVAESLSNLSNAHLRQGDFAEARRAAELALTRLEEQYGAEHPLLLNPLNNVASVLMAQMEYSRAQAMFDRALRLVMAYRGPDHPLRATLLNNLGTTLRRQQRHAEALEYLRRARAQMERTLGPDHPNLASVSNNMGTVLVEQGQHREALRHYENALRLRRELLGEDHPKVAQVRVNIAGVYHHLRQPEQTLRHVEPAIAVLEGKLGARHLSVNLARLRQGQALIALARHDDARSILTTSREALEEKLGLHHGVTAAALQALAENELGAEQPARAVELARQTLEILEGFETTLPHEQGQVSLLLAKALRASGGGSEEVLERTEQALTLLHEAGAVALLDLTDAEAFRATL